MTGQQAETQAQSGHTASGSRANRESRKAQRIGDPVVPRLLPLKDAAKYLGLTVWAMRERVWAGDIPMVRFPGGRKIYIDVRDLEKFIERNKITIH